MPAVILLERGDSNDKLHSTLLLGYREAKGFKKHILDRKHIPGGKEQQQGLHWGQALDRFTGVMV